MGNQGARWSGGTAKSVDFAQTHSEQQGQELEKARDISERRTQRRGAGLKPGPYRVVRKQMRYLWAAPEWVMRATKSRRLSVTVEP
jgi:hypothetical protein